MIFLFLFLMVFPVKWLLFELNSRHLCTLLHQLYCTGGAVFAAGSADLSVDGLGKMISTGFWHFLQGSLLTG